MRTDRRLLLGGAIATVAAWIVAFSYITTRDPAWAGAAFGALQAITALIALLAAITAIAIALPDYRNLREQLLRRPKLVVWVGIVVDGRPAERFDDDVVIDTAVANLHVVVSNSGDLAVLSREVVHGGLPVGCCR